MKLARNLKAGRRKDQLGQYYVLHCFVHLKKYWRKFLNFTVNIRDLVEFVEIRIIFSDLRNRNTNALSLWTTNSIKNSSHCHHFTRLSLYKLGFNYMILWYCIIFRENYETFITSTNNDTAHTRFVRSLFELIY